MNIAERYIRLAHAIDAHAPGFIDGYGGPQEWADRDRRDPGQLRREAADLARRVEDVPEADRRAWLTVQVRAMQTMTRLLDGEQLRYSDEVRGLYDIEPRRADHAALEASLQIMEDALPGTGPLVHRKNALRDRVTVPPSALLDVTAPILAELRERTRARFGLPQGEGFSIGLVSGKPWSGYNWPLGGLQSRIDINTDLPVTLTALPDLMAHEGYPGHHTEHSTKEARLVRERGWLEHHIQLINAPECVVSEGVAMNALDAVMSREELHSWLTGELAVRAGLDPDDVAAMLRVAEAQSSMKGVSGAAAMLLHEDGRPEAEVIEFLSRYNVVSEEHARKNLEFITQPNLRAYIFTYAVGSDLVRGFMASHGQDAFGRLLTEPLTPGQLEMQVPVA
ncbi:hypothetical protein [Deinococcus deserti]|uniref:DUF885 domain-containing protein n=1 Tax=Deinococcus deserti (strain DSM 17065 / CIP 109153 / LMG 22923 / VCD115) TaxID=546414 RepID=C1CX59_DEIDV|nr:hypothetical protein [Deinococcus deserti]ACO46776.2 hypothetical protein Deide_17900 [Deinococcus deserti VCD115]